MLRKDIIHVTIITLYLYVDKYVIQVHIYSLQIVCCCCRSCDFIEQSEEGLRYQTVSNESVFHRSGVWCAGRNQFVERDTASRSLSPSI